MEVKKLTDYVVVFHDVIPEKVLENFLDFCKESDEFNKAEVIGENNMNNQDIVRENIRKTLTMHLQSFGEKSLTKVHWANFFNRTFTDFINNYREKIGTSELFHIESIEVLKYVNNGFYKFHVDYHKKYPRAFSCIFLVNEDYEGGELVFKFPNSKEIHKIEKKKNSLIIWPSNFLYPHSVLPVTKGNRYSIVAWAS